MDNHQAWTGRILALGVGFIGMGVLAYLALDGNEAALGALISSVGSVVTFYFMETTNK